MKYQIYGKVEITGYAYNRLMDSWLHEVFSQQISERYSYEEIFINEMELPSGLKVGDYIHHGERKMLIEKISYLNDSTALYTDEIVKHEIDMLSREKAMNRKHEDEIRYLKNEKKKMVDLVNSNVLKRIFCRWHFDYKNYKRSGK